jgi:hypothetical protein
MTHRSVAFVTMGQCTCVVVHSARARYDLVETLKSFLVQLLKLVELQLATGSSATPPPQCIQLVNPLGNLLGLDTGTGSHTENGGHGDQEQNATLNQATRV